MLCTVSLPGRTPSEIHLRGLLDTDTGVRWVPLRCVCPDLQPQRQNPAVDRQDGSCDQTESHQMDDSSSEDSDADNASHHSDETINPSSIALSQAACPYQDLWAGQ
ncbi:uncharacterized protein M8220_002547 isoform 1-T1 [Acridotheres tristis]